MGNVTNLFEGMPRRRSQYNERPFAEQMEAEKRPHQKELPKTAAELVEASGTEDIRNAIKGLVLVLENYNKPSIPSLHRSAKRIVRKEGLNFLVLVQRIEKMMGGKKITALSGKSTQEAMGRHSFEEIMSYAQDAVWKTEEDGFEDMPSAGLEEFRPAEAPGAIRKKAVNF